MKVNNKSGLDAAAQTSNAGKKSNVGAAKGSKGEAGQLDSAKIELSARAQDIKKIKDAVNKSPDVDEAKVAKFRALIASGQYKINPEGTADKMVNEFAYQGILED